MNIDLRKTPATRFVQKLIKRHGRLECEKCGRPVPYVPHVCKPNRAR